MSGARFYFLTGVGALLELGLLNLAMQRAVANGFTDDPPVLVKPETMDGTGLGEHARRSTTFPPTTCTWWAPPMPLAGTTRTRSCPLTPR